MDEKENHHGAAFSRELAHDARDVVGEYAGEGAGEEGLIDGPELVDETCGICTRRAGKLYNARSRLYRSQILQVNTRWKALAEIYTMHSFAPLWNPLAKNGEKRAWPKQP